MVICAAGWLEDGLPVSCEKTITYIEVLQMIAERCAAGTEAGRDPGPDAIRQVQTDGCFSATEHAIKHCQSEAHTPLVGGVANFSTCSDRASIDAVGRTTAIGKDVLATLPEIKNAHYQLEAPRAFIADATARAGADPVS
ncbi:MAG: trimethylamine methyltransferase family protein [Alphaproteobacteria bacterium]|nr:trimethylamine methyltransferase family protein [Alphaproteobacteria bacterium]NNF24072.1 hypothetical protein [Paracoccaceae bacterium]